MKLNLWKLDDHSELVEALFAAHREAAIANDNASKLCVQQAWGGSGRFENAIIAGMATIGALHAPLTQARELWDDWYLENYHYEWGARFSGGRVPGFGNSFDVEDPKFLPVSDLLQNTHRYSRHWEMLNDLARLVSIETSTEALLLPNAALYTAIVASICEVPRGLECTLFALARIPAWAEMCGAVQHPKVGGVR